MVAAELDPRRVAHYGPSVLRVCRRHLSNADLVWEAYQATFLAYSKQRETLDHGRSLGPWFKETARRCSLATLRRETKHKRQQIEDTPGETPQHEQAVVQAELVTVLLEEFETLSPPQQEVLRMVYCEGLSHQEVSVRVGCPLGSIHSRVESAKSQLRRRLTRRGVTVSTILLMFLLSDNAQASVGVVARRPIGSPVFFRRRLLGATTILLALLAVLVHQPKESWAMIGLGEPVSADTQKVAQLGICEHHATESLSSPESIAKN